LKGDEGLMMKYHLKIKEKLMSILLLINLIASIVFTSVYYIDLKNNIISGIDKQLYAIVYGTSNLIPARFFNRIHDATSITPAEHLQIMQQLSNYAYQTGTTYIYAYMQFDNKIMTVATSATPEELTQKTYEPFFYHYKTAGTSLYQAFHDQQPQVGEYTDKYGTFRSLFVPFVDDHGRTYVIGSDIPINFVNATLHNALFTSLLIGVVGFISVLTATFLVVNHIVKPLTQLIHFTSEIGEQDFVVNPVVQTELKQISINRCDEVSKLAQALCYMMNMLEKFIIRIRETTILNERVEADLRAARDIQMGILPQRFPPFPEHQEFSLHALIEPAKTVGGDFYDYFMIDRQRLFFIIGDVSGKGIPAALFMAITTTLFKNCVRQNRWPIHEIVSQVNKDLAAENPSFMFVTAFAGILDIRTGVIDYCDAGHEVPIIVRHQQRDLEHLQKQGGIALGLNDHHQFVKNTVQLLPDDVLFVFTDGISEAMNESDELFSTERIEALLAQHDQPSTTSVIEKIVQAVHNHAGTTPQSDDITALAIQFKGLPCIS
jgi:sigma-B regulation protein RsbU (phosphoserine phosphatase)